MKSITFYASEVSVIAGLNPYRQIQDTFLEVWRRCFLDQVEAAEHHTNQDAMTEYEAIQKFIATNDSDGEVIKTITQTIESKTTTELCSRLRECSSLAIMDKLDETQQQQVLGVIRSNIYCGYGSKEETPTIESYERDTKTQITSRNDKFHKKQLYADADIKVYVGGKIDGRKEDGTIIEVKNRMKRFFNPLPAYDICQLQTYMFILDSTKGELVEQLKHNRSDRKVSLIEYDHAYFDTKIKPELIAFAKQLDAFTQRTDLHDRFLLADSAERKLIISSI